MRATNTQATKLATMLSQLEREVEELTVEQEEVSSREDVDSAPMFVK